MSLKTERYGPISVAVIAGVAAAAFDAVAELEPFSRYVSAGTMTLGLVVVGFTATQRNMLLGMGGSKVLRFAANTGYYKDIISYLAHCIFAGLSVTVLSLVGLFIDTCSLEWTSWLALWVGSIVLVIGILIRNEMLASRAGESHPHALPEPYVSLSTHTAPSARPCPRNKGQWANNVG